MTANLPELVNEGLELSAVGVGIVFTALIIVGITVAIIGALTRERSAVTHKPNDAIPEASLTQISKHTVVLLAAAATVACKRPVRIRRVRFVSHKHIPTSWAATARQDHVQETL